MKILALVLALAILPGCVSIKEVVIFKNQQAPRK
jgi:hypothetical protein